MQSETHCVSYWSLEHAAQVESGERSGGSWMCSLHCTPTIEPRHEHQLETMKAPLFEFDDRLTYESEMKYTAYGSKRFPIPVLLRRRSIGVHRRWTSAHFAHSFAVSNGAIECPIDQPLWWWFDLSLEVSNQCRFHLLAWPLLCRAIDWTWHANPRTPIWLNEILLKNWNENKITN